MHMQKIKLLSQLCVGVVFALMVVCYADERRQQIYILESHVTEDVTGARISEVKAKVDPKSEIVLSNTSKGMESPKVYSNSAHTIVGFNASPGRASYNINLVWLSNEGTCSVNQNLNTRLATILRDNGFTGTFDEDGLYLDDIRERTLYVAFRSDNGREFFTFAVNVDNEGQLHLVANSINANSPRQQPR
jgi:hypothetical protein